MKQRSIQTVRTIIVAATSLIFNKNQNLSPLLLSARSVNYLFDHRRGMIARSTDLSKASMLRSGYFLSLFLSFPWQQGLRWRWWRRFRLWACSSCILASFALVLTNLDSSVPFLHKWGFHPSSCEAEEYPHQKATPLSTWIDSWPQVSPSLDTVLIYSSLSALSNGQRARDASIG